MKVDKKDNKNNGKKTNKNKFTLKALPQRSLKLFSNHSGKICVGLLMAGSGLGVAAASGVIPAGLATTVTVATVASMSGAAVCAAYTIAYKVGRKDGQEALQEAEEKKENEITNNNSHNDATGESKEIDKKLDAILSTTSSLNIKIEEMHAESKAKEELQDLKDLHQVEQTGKLSKKVERHDNLFKRYGFYADKNKNIRNPANSAANDADAENNLPVPGIRRPFPK